ncbi:MAG: hypothetical protein OEY01_14235, partial [Desulfobulbaceae bacterium]|nr:hypothetical protein [Desulfobulbaceae bacterium]HIJ79840.1 hypothetical protein [Deltaproteobacteria bacterium]
ISTQELITDIPPSLKKNFTGVIRASVLSLMDMIQQMMPGKQRITVMSHSATNLPETESEYRNAAKQYNLILDFRYFADEKQVGETMREIAGQSDFILLYPPGITNHDVTEIVKWQNQLKLPVLSQLKSHIKAGLLGGPATDLDKTSPKLAEYIDKILQGREPAQLPYFYYQTKYVINLQTASTLKQDIPVDITTNAEIIF